MAEGLWVWPYSSEKAALLVLPFCFVTFILDKQNKSKRV
jgi:hypothetical protein